MLRAADVHFGYGDTPVLRGVTAEVPAGAFLGILGPNGSGKTTLLRLFTGVLRPRRGVVTLDGVDVSGLPRHTLARRMAVVPQETHLAFDYSVLEIVLMGRYPHLGVFEVEGPADLAIAREALRATGTSALESRAFVTLSGGEKQRVIIASALAQILNGGNGRASPESGRRSQADSAPVASDGGGLLLLDEPTTALDLAYQLETARLLRRLHGRGGITMIVSTHDLNFAASVCSSLVLLREGRIVAAGSTREVLTSANVRLLYGVHADVTRHAAAGHLIVVPISLAEGSEGA